MSILAMAPVENSAKDDAVQDPVPAPAGTVIQQIGTGTADSGQPIVLVPPKAVVPPGLGTKPLGADYNDVPLPDFIDEVFGSQLGLSHTIQPDLLKHGGTVTLRMRGEVAPPDLYRIAQATLALQGVTTVDEGGLLVFRPGDVSGLASGGSAPMVVFYPLQVVGNAKITGWLDEMLAETGLKVYDDLVRNGLLIAGTAAAVQSALDMVRVLDQPLARAGASILIEPALVPAAELAGDLERILLSEGKGATVRPPLGSVIALPLVSRNAIIVFAQDEQTLVHVREWVMQLERERRRRGDQGIFTYHVRNTRAAAIVDSLGMLAAGARPVDAKPRSIPVEEDDEPAETQEPASPEPPAAQKPREDTGGTLVADEHRNAVMFRGSAREWARLLPSVKAMDAHTPAVLVDMLVAELSLDDSFESGVEWLATGSLGDYGVRYGTLGGLGLGTNGFNLQIEDAGEVRALVNLFEGNSSIAIRSRPRLVVNSGQSARIDVGDEIPVLRSSSRSTENPDAPVVNNIEYRRTGLLLEVRPTVFADDRVELELSQEFSQAQQTTTSAIDSPTILNRSIQATLEIRDGGAVLLGGLIASRAVDDQQGIPMLARIPGVGAAFRRDGSNAARTELLVLVRSYVLRNPGEVPPGTWVAPPQALNECRPGAPGSCQ